MTDNQKTSGINYITRKYSSVKYRASLCPTVLYFIELLYNVFSCAAQKTELKHVLTSHFRN